MSEDQLNKDDRFDCLDYKELEPCKFSFDSSSMSTFNEFFGVNSFRILDETFIRLIDNDDLYKEGFQLKDESLENNLVEVVVKKEKTEVKFVASNSYPIFHCGVVVKNQFIMNGKIYEYMLVHLVGRMNNIDVDKSMIKCHFTKTFKQRNFLKLQMILNSLISLQIIMALMCQRNLEKKFIIFTLN